MTNFVNLTPHAIVLAATDGSRQTVPTSGTVARVASMQGTVVAEAAGLPIYSRTVFGAVEGVPEPQEDTIYIVSSLVLGALSGRPDVVAPGTGPADGAIRAPNGQVEAVTRLIAAV